MSQIKKLKFGIFFLVAVFACFLFGCEKTTPVNDIYFNIGDGQQIILIVGESLEMENYVSIKPTYATNQDFEISSFNENIVKVIGHKIIAIAEGEAQIKVTSSDNELKQDLMTVLVRKTKNTLASPRNLIYNPENETFTFDSVSYATSYTFKLNGTQYELGNSNVFSVKQNDVKIVDKVVYAEVRANAPTYTNALYDSPYAEYRMYQAGGVENLIVQNGNLKFDKSNESLKVDVYLDNQLFIKDSSLNNISLTELDELYANANINVGVETYISEEFKVGHPTNVTYFKSQRQLVNVNVLDVPELKINQSVLSWQNVRYCTGYAIIIDGIKRAETTNNYFDLETIDDYKTLVSSTKIRTLMVEPIINENTVNVAKTARVNSINISWLASTEISCNNEGLIWNSVEGAQVYKYVLKGYETDLAGSTTLTNYSFVGSAAGSYTIEVQAVGGFNKDDVYYLSSNVTTKEFTKQAMVSAQIEDYTLKISDLNNCICSVNFDKANYDQELQGDGSTAELDMHLFRFDAGKHVISLIKHGDKNSIPSDVFKVEFTQLEEIDNVRVVDGKAKFDRSNINENAIMCLSVNDNSVSPFNNVANIEISSEDGSEYLFNTTSGENFIPSGSYATYVYVRGDGSSTFSVRENGTDLKICQTIYFSVLEAPVVNIKNTSEATLTYQQVSRATGYEVFKNNIIVDTVEELYYNFDLDSGENATYSVRAVGDGVRILNSTFSEDVNIFRLKTPTLQYNGETDRLIKKDENDASHIVGFELKIDGAISDYDFDNSNEKLGLTKNSNLSFITLAISQKIENVNYLNSLPFVLNLKKISNLATIEMDSESNLKITPTKLDEGNEYNLNPHDKEYELEIEFEFANKEGASAIVERYRSISGGSRLVNVESGSNLYYKYENESYIVELIKDHNAVLAGLVNEFKVKVKFIEPSAGDNNLINSEYTNQVTLELNRISTATKVEVNSDNQLVLTPANHDKKYRIDIMFNNDESLTFVDAETKLVCGEFALPYNYDEENKCYIIDLLDDKYDVLVGALKTNFTFRIKYSHNFDNSSTDLDSIYSTDYAVTVLSESTLSRDGQNIKFTNVKYDYDFRNYGILVNNKHFITLTEDITAKSDGFLTIDIETILSNTPNDIIETTNSINVITLNILSSESNPELSIKSDTLRTERTKTIVLTTAKNNSELDNSTYVTFNMYDTDYYKEYIIDIYNNLDTIIATKRYDDNNSLDGTISLKLDDIEGITSTFKIIGYVASAQALNGVEIFNSVKSNILEISKVDEVTELKVSNSLLNFKTVENVAGYEVYQVTGTGGIKLNTNLITSNEETAEFKLPVLTEDSEIVVKAIAIDKNYSNSYYSNAVNVKVLSSVRIEVEEGLFKFNLPTQISELLQNENIIVTVDITNKQGNPDPIQFTNIADLNGITIDYLNKCLYIEPSLLLNYYSESLMAEDLTFTLTVSYNDVDPQNTYYLNSNTVSISAYGLKGPSEVKKTTSSDMTEVEQITWTPSNKNGLNIGEENIEIITVEVGYILMIEHTVNDETTIYRSDDRKLKYYNTTTGKYESYNKYLTGSSVIFPYGWDNNDDGDFEDENDVIFGAGIYLISVQSVPSTNITGYNLLRSKFTQAQSFEVLNIVDVSVSAGKLAWTAGTNANKFKVELFEEGETEAILTDYVYTWEYELTSVLDEYDGVLKAVVTALSTRDDLLSSKQSEPIYVYRLPKAKAVTIEDGQIIIEATKFFSAAEIIFVDTITHKEYVQTYINTTFADQLAGLEIDTWQGFTDNAKIDETNKFHIDASELNAVLDGRDYYLKVVLIGNTDSSLGILSSAECTEISQLTATKMSPNLIEVELGVLRFAPNSEYATITTNGEIKYTPYININYVFNAQTPTEFWQKTAVYKISIIHSRTLQTIYAVDYYSFIYAKNNNILTADEYSVLEYTNNGLYAIVKYAVQDGEYIYFNVYENNELNLRDYDTLVYYETTETMNNGVNTFSSITTTMKTIDLAQGGSFTINLIMMGGDSYAVGEEMVGYINAGVSAIKTFVRYGDNILSTTDGQISFNDLRAVIMDVVTDNPVYKIVVTPLNTTNSMVFYLYYTSESDAMIIAQRHDPENYDKATYVQIEIENNNEVVDLKIDSPVLLEDNLEETEEDVSEETPKDNQPKLLFDLSKYINPGAYKINIRTLAGLGNGNSGEKDYLLNAKEPSTSSIFYKLSDAAFTTINGVLEFEQSYIVSGSEYQYYNDYEVTLSYGDESITYDLVKGDEGLSYDSVNHKFRYTIPSEVSDGENTIVFAAGTDNIYTVNIRAKGIDNFILNGTYVEANKLEISKAYGVVEEESNKLRVDNGILKWKVENYSVDQPVTTIIKIDYKDLNNELKTFNIISYDSDKVLDENGEYQYHYYVFKDTAYENGFKLVHNNNGNYTISVYITSSKENVLNSNYSNPIQTNRLNEVDVESIKTIAGILKWDAVDEASSYEIKIGKKKFDSAKNSLDVSTLGIDVGTYEVNIKAIGSNCINGPYLNNPVSGFIQLDKVDTKSIKINQETISWDSVENALGYKVVVSYNTDSKVEFITETNSFILNEIKIDDNISIQISGQFELAISAIGIGESKLFNSAPVTFVSSTDVPKAVEKVEFNDTTNSIEITVSSDDFLDGDSLSIIGIYTKYTENGNSIAEDYFASIKAEKGQTIYSLQLKVMALYKNIYVIVNRGETLSSNRKELAKPIDLHLFSYGEGIEQNPYRIENAEQLLNISYYPNSYFVLTSSINMEGVDIGARLDSYGAIIAREFTGTLDGTGVNDKFKIFGFNANTLSNRRNFALFGELNGATIKNLIIGSADSQLNVLNTFANSTTGVIKLSLIATEANDSTLSDIQIINTKITFELSSGGSIGELYISGLVAKSSNLTVSGVKANIKVEVKGNNNIGSSYIGGVIANAKTSKVSDSVVNLTISAPEGTTLTYVGGVYAYFIGTTDKEISINETTATVNVDDNVQMYCFGGLVGSAMYINIESCKTYGSYSNTNIASNCYIGGLIGDASGSDIKKSGTYMTISLTIITRYDNQYFGLIVGSISKYMNGTESNIIDCYSNSYNGENNQTIINDEGSVTLGIYGYNNQANITGTNQANDEAN